jgi:Zn-dependent peptidase ImmA (M78 family)
MKTDLQNVKNKAEQLIEQYALSSPVRVFELADLIGIGWKLCSSEDLTRMLSDNDKNVSAAELKETITDILGCYDKEKKVLYLHDTNQPITRKRFTMAHEIGHYILHGDAKDTHHFRKTYYRRDILKPTDAYEKEANYFAGYLLMPDRDILSVLPYSRMMISGDEIVDKYSKIFAVSPESMRIRLRTFKEEHEEPWVRYSLSQKLF